MSGGHWGYMSTKLEERGRSAGEIWRLMAALEHELDWGICMDTCMHCARNRLVPALQAFFDNNCEDSTTSIAIARDSKQHMCESCEERHNRG